MAYCPKCGIEVERDSRPCPLCDFLIPKVGKNNLNTESRFPHIDHMNLEQKGNRFYMIYIVFSLLFFISILIMLIIDLLDNRVLTWSMYSNICVLAVWIILYFVLGFVVSFYKNVIGISIDIIGLLFGLDYLDNGLSWFLPVAFPLTLGTTLVMLFYYNFINSLKVKGFNIIGYSLISVVFICLWVNFLINHYLHQERPLGWSLVVSVPLLIISFIALYISYGLPERVKQKMIKKFHI